MKKLLTLAASSLLCLMLSTAPVRAAEVHICAAASLKEAVNELADSFSRKHPGVTIVRNFGASGTLAKQIESGAPADIFICANKEWMTYLKGRKLVAPSSVAAFAVNTLVFAGGTGKKVTGMQDLAALGRIAIGSPKSVPAGEYAMESIKKAGLENPLGEKLVFAKDVRESMMYAERGEVDGAFVYRTDALLGKRAKILFTVPQQLYPQVSYPMALTAPGSSSNAAMLFFKFLQSEETKKILKRYGFGIKP